MAIEKVSLPDGTVVVIDEWLHFPVFSSCEMAATDGIRLRLFTYVVGGRLPATPTIAARNATITDTNQVAIGRMNWDEGYRVFSETYEIFGATDADEGSSPGILTAESPVVDALNLRRLQRDLVIKLNIGADIAKPQSRAPFSWYHQGVGPVMYPCGDQPTANFAFSGGTGGYADWQEQRRYKLPIKISPDQTMYVEVASALGTVSGLTQNLYLRWYLDGTKKRPLG